LSGSAKLFNIPFNLSQRNLVQAWIGLSSQLIFSPPTVTGAWSFLIYFWSEILTLLSALINMLEKMVNPISNDKHIVLNLFILTIE